MKNESVVIEKQIVKTNNRLARLASMYDRIKKMEIRNLFRSMPEILNGYRREYGKLVIDVQHVDKPVSDLQTNFTSDAQREVVEKKIGKRILVSIRTAKNNALLGIINHTLPPRVFTRLKKEEEVIKDRQTELVKKRDRLVSKLEKVQSAAQLPAVTDEQQPKKRGRKSNAEKAQVAQQPQAQAQPKALKKSINQMMSTLKKSRNGKKLLEEMKSDPSGKELLNLLKHPETFSHQEKEAAAA